MRYATEDLPEVYEIIDIQILADHYGTMGTRDRRKFYVETSFDYTGGWVWDTLQLEGVTIYEDADVLVVDASMSGSLTPNSIFTVSVR